MIKAYSGLIFGKSDYWHPDMLVNKNISINEIGCYYVDTRPKYIYPGKFDKYEIPLVEIDNELKYFPVTIAQYALGNFDIYMDTKDQKYFNICKKCGQWFIDNLCEINTNVFGFINDYDKQMYYLKNPWLSSLGQGQAMSVLSRIYFVNKDLECLKCCEKLLNSFKVESKNKGVFTTLNGDDFYEEYPSETPSYVLNGFIFSLWGLLDYYIVSKNEVALELYQKGVKTLENNIGKYNIKFINWSRYDLYPFKIKDIASIFYHKLHIEQLKAMYYLTNEDIFKEYYIKWDKSRKNILKYVIATLYKINHKLSVKNMSNYVPSINKEK